MTMPPPKPRRPPHLVNDAVEEILLRLPPDDPACLVRAAAVCRTWRRVLTTDAAFSVRYRAFHGTPPVLRFLRRSYFVHDCRDGLVFLGDHRELPEEPESFLSTFQFAAVGRRRACPDGGHFLVTSLGFQFDAEVTANACHYSSETGEWGPPTSVPFDYVRRRSYNRSCFIADAVYFAGEFGNVVLRYDLVRQ
ncbi:hypothetical protein PR202_ga28489 [Eleusine coracana subsp. coracana]|uniref:F-box domain-containing protein n=1 Tax=Eleusine coracana subsp. coracana TaxID=191504 RepID=A0AAV5DJ85_ELECO|nr:hypothetical protein PR202_ga28489 [Eleusine coracana subsp. coracana]